MENLYKTDFINKTHLFIKRFGVSQIFMKPLRICFAPIILRFKKKKEFWFNNKKYFYYYHKYNTTWANERCVEIPIAMDFLRTRGGNILEIGNVLSHYFKSSWEIIDKYEKSSKTINQDISSFNPSTKYNAIVSVSTFEHVGYDDDNHGGSSKDKIINALDNIKNNCLERKGRILIIAPIGYNPDMDILVSNNLLELEVRFMKKISKNEWFEVNKEIALKSGYGKPFAYANCIMIGEYAKE